MRRLSLLAAASALLVPALCLFTADPAEAFRSSSAADAAEVVVTFVGSDLAPLACSARPEPSSLIVRIGTWVTLANFTGADATVDLGATQPIEVAKDAAISVRLGRGEHTITMRPKCVETFGVEPVTISVRRAADLPATPTPGPASAPAATPTGPPLALALPSGSPGTTPDPIVSSGQAGTGQVGGGPIPTLPVAGGAAASPDRAEVDLGLDVQAGTAAHPLSSRPDGRGRRLLALVATICVFGVTSAIIRAIVAQRTTSGLAPR